MKRNDSVVLIKVENPDDPETSDINIWETVISKVTKTKYHVENIIFNKTDCQRKFSNITYVVLQNPTPDVIKIVREFREKKMKEAVNLFKTAATNCLSELEKIDRRFQNA